ncbi:MAG: DNA polymerase III subunit alpha [Acidimicrobiales bacterium]
MGSSFTHLHVHTEFSMLDGASRLDELVAKAAADGQPALAITDHGNMYGVLDFYKACNDHGIKPIIGSELYQADDSRHERPSRRGKIDDSGGSTDGGKKLYYHLIALAENQTGYKNLIQLSSRAYMEGYYYKPRVDWEVLSDHAEGIIATTGCLGGHVLQDIMGGREERALEKAARLQDIFGRDNLFIELQDHGIPEQAATNPKLIEIARKINAPLIVTSDSHYTNRADHAAHDALLCVQTGSLMSDPDRFKFHGDDHYLKTAAETRAQWAELPEACDNTLWIAERCNVEIEFGKPLLPDFPVPDEFEGVDDYLRFKTYEGAKIRWGDNLPAEVTERLDYELDVIKNMGFSSYFLITWDMIRYAREVGIRVGPGRGSAAGCAVAYTLWITDLDPIKYDLLFERFLNPSRISMPDIDMDFDSRYRDQMIRYCADRYGRDRVAQIITFGQIKARAAVRDAARVLGYPYAVGDKIAKAMPPLIMGRDTPLKYCFEDSEKYHDGYKMATELRTMVDTEPDVAKVVDVAMGLEGLRRSDGIHAAAVVITKDPLTNYLPIQRKPEAGMAIEDAPVVTQYEGGAVESLGLLKMDFLGLRNLDVISDSLAMIEQVHGVTIDIDHVDLTDAKTYGLLQAGQTIGVFQLESGPMRALMRSMAPTGFDDVAALVALYRPGPMAANMHNDYADRKNGRQEVTQLHEDATDILGETYGLMIYQEQMMRMSQKFAGYSLADADNLRKAAGKKKRELMAKERTKFVAGCDENGYGAQFGEDLFTLIEGFADYAFNKSHSYGYGFVSFQTAFLKANYPVEYLSSLLTSVKNSLEKAAIYLNECRQLGIRVLVPDINRSERDFLSITIPEEEAHDNPSGLNAIAFGLSAVRNVGDALVELILEERRANGPFESFLDFCERVDYSVLNKRTIESLIKAGAFDSLGHPRKGLGLVHEELIDKTVSSRKEHDMGVMTLFGAAAEEDDGPGFDDRPDIPDLEFDKSQRLKFEKEMLGLYVSDHPLMGLDGALRRKAEHSLSSMETMDDGDLIVVGGVVTGLQRKWTKKGDLMGVFVLEDLVSSAEVMVFPRTFADFGHLLEDDRVIVLRARLQKRDEETKLMAQAIEIFEPELQGSAPPLRLVVRPEQLSEAMIRDLKHVLSGHHGESAVYIHLNDTQAVKLSDEFCVDTSNGLIPELRVLLGEEAVVL